MIAVGVALTVAGVAGGLAGMHLMLVLIPIGLATTVLGLLDYTWLLRGSEPTPLMLLAILLGEAAATLAIIIIEGWV
jgi:hypothetical protein